MRPEDKPIFEALTDEQVMALTIRGEAAVEYLPFGRPALAGIGYVIKNRADHPSYFGVGIKGVCFHPKAFSCYLSISAKQVYDELLRIAKDWDSLIVKMPILQACVSVAEGILAGAEPNPVNHATFYYNPKVCDPNWDEDMTFVCQIGNHRFYATE